MNSRDLRSLQHLEDLIYYDGPLLSLFKLPDSRQFLFKLSDLGEDSTEVWLAFQVSDESLAAYRGGDKTLRDLVLEVNQHFIVDVGLSGEWLGVEKVARDDIPVSYMPLEGSYLPEVSEAKARPRLE